MGLGIEAMRGFRDNLQERMSFGKEGFGCFLVERISHPVGKSLCVCLAYILPKLFLVRGATDFKTFCIMHVLIVRMISHELNHKCNFCQLEVVACVRTRCMMWSLSNLSMTLPLSHRGHILPMRAYFGYILKAIGQWGFSYCDECGELCGGKTCVECATALLIARKKEDMRAHEDKVKSENFRKASYPRYDQIENRHELYYQELTDLQSSHYVL